MWLLCLNKVDGGIGYILDTSENWGKTLNYTTSVSVHVDLTSKSVQSKTILLMGIQSTDTDYRWGYGCEQNYFLQQSFKWYLKSLIDFTVLRYRKNGLHIHRCRFMLQIESSLVASKMDCWNNLQNWLTLYICHLKILQRGVLFYK